MESMAKVSADLKKLIDKSENDASTQLLINIHTGLLWEVDHYALRERGYPEGGWMLYSDTSKEDILALLHIARGFVGSIDLTGE